MKAIITGTVIQAAFPDLRKQGSRPVVGVEWNPATARETLHPPAVG